MDFKNHSYAGSEDLGSMSPAMERNNIMDGSSVDGTSEGFHEPASDSSSPGNGPPVFAGSTDNTLLMDVWLGEKFLESIIALQLHSQADEEEVVSSLEFKLKANLQDFPFVKCCGYLHKKGASEDFDLGGTKDYRNALLSYVGHVAQEGTRSRETLARNAIARFVNTNPVITGLPWNENPHIHNQRPVAHDVHPHEPNRGILFTRIETPREQRAVPTNTHPGNPSVQNGSTPRQSGTSVRSNKPPLTPGEYAKYTSLLMENSDHVDMKPKWTEKNIGTTDRPFFRCIVTFRGITAQGEGRKKKDAKHEAAFNACQKLGLQL